MLLDADVRTFLTSVEEHRRGVFEVSKAAVGPNREEKNRKVKKNA
jgi:hypothetical protein